MGHAPTSGQYPDRAPRRPVVRDQQLCARALARTWGTTLVLALTEFGRTARENGSGGTDHGTGGVMLAFGGALRGGKAFGTWPGLATTVTFLEDRDLLPTDDLRRYPAHALRSLFGLDRWPVEQSSFPSLDTGPTTGGSHITQEAAAQSQIQSRLTFAAGYRSAITTPREARGTAGADGETCAHASRPRGSGHVRTATSRAITSRMSSSAPSMSILTKAMRRYGPRFLAQEGREIDQRHIERSRRRRCLRPPATIVLLTEAPFRVPLEILGAHQAHAARTDADRRVYQLTFGNAPNFSTSRIQGIGVWFEGHHVGPGRGKPRRDHRPMFAPQSTARSPGPASP